MPGRILVVIGGSAGSLTPLTSVLQGLPASFSACVLIVVHSSPESAGGLAKVLSRSSHIPVTMATEGRPIERGIFVAPPNHHLIVTPGRMHVTLGPKENGFRPAVDPLFRTAAHAYESLVIGVILSGALDDGAYGMSEIKAAGGLTIVQDPGEADIDSMPRHAMRYVDLDYVVAAADIAPLLCRETAAPPHVGEVI